MRKPFDAGIGYDGIEQTRHDFFSAAHSMLIRAFSDADNRGDTFTNRHFIFFSNNAIQHPLVQIQLGIETTPF